MLQARRLSALFAAVAVSALSLAAQSTLDVKDAFGRSVAQRGITLLQWEGHMANPAIRLTVSLPDGVAGPATLEVSSDCSRMMFDRNTDDRRGLGTRLRYQSGSKTADLWVSIFPARSYGDEDHKLYFHLWDSTRNGAADLVIPVHVLNQNKPHQPSFEIHLDFSKDKTGFLKDPHVRQVCELAANDWAYYIDDMQLDPVKAGDERTEIWNSDGFVSTFQVANAESYTGFLMYMSGIAGPELRSGGAPSEIGKHQTSGGRPLPLLRSGNVDVEVQGNYHRLGWFLTTCDDDWWCSGSLRDEPADLYSIMLHEMGHALAFHEKYAAAEAARRRGSWTDPEVHAYLGRDPIFDGSDHFAGSVDPASGFGVFGAEYDARMMVRRWLITKAHLLLLKSVGYKIRPVSCFDALKASCPEHGDLRSGAAATVTLRASGGIPAYDWVVADGTLPPGLHLDSFTGEVSGTPTQAGTYPVTLRVTDQSPKPISAEIRETLVVR
jgi:hypothetical protein